MDKSEFDINEEEFDSFLEMLRVPENEQTIVEIFATIEVLTGSGSESIPDMGVYEYDQEIDVMLGLNIGNSRKPIELSPEIMESTLKIYLDKLGESSIIADDIIEILLLCKNHRHNIKEFYDNAVSKIEDYIFESSNSISPKSHISINKPSIYLSFHILRAYLKAENGDFDGAKSIWNGLDQDWMLRVPHKQSHLLLHLFMSHLCTDEWDKASEYFGLLWGTTKSMTMSDRHSTSTLDDWTCAILILWFFILNCSAFCSYFRKHNKIRSSTYLSQKKLKIICNLDKKFILDLVTPAYYNKFRELHPELPEITSDSDIGLQK
ncbi:hypothetical protein LCGC14_1533370 [marine sediment metagenome]|uniref:Uncharacterized protein n=1 Tax=marine sediment metagenome TaxID=412755 RepID=A0A0F9LB62_9ZZZZ